MGRIDERHRDQTETWQVRPRQPTTLHRGARRGWFDRAAAAAGLTDRTAHELRHTAVSLAVSAGANVKAVQAMLGNAKAAMTLDVYADLFDDDLEAVAKRLARLARGGGGATVVDLPGPAASR